MGIMLYDKNADFSAFSLGHAGLYTSVTANLLSLFELRRSIGKASKNSAPASALPASITGSPTINPTSIDLTTTGQVTFPSTPSNGGENSFAAIVKVKNGGTVADCPIGSIVLVPATNGNIYLSHFNRRFQITTTLFNSQTAPTTLVTSPTASLDAPSDGSLDGTSQLVVVTVKSQSALDLYWPSRSLRATTAIAAGQYAYFNQNVANRNWRGLAGGTAAQNVSMFAHWDRALSAAEVATFYGEMKKQYGQIGLVI